MKVRLAGIVPESIVDGPGYRLAVFAQGCPHGCPECHNTQTHDPQGGALRDTGEVIAMLGANPLVCGVTLTGGEPMMQPEPMAEIARAARQRGMSVWCYTGFTLEALQAEGRSDRLRLLEQVDVLVDGPYLARERSLELLYRGSRNQRLIDMKRTLAEGTLRLYEPEAW